MTKVSWKSLGVAGLAAAIAVSMASLLAARGTAAAPVNSVQIEPAAAAVAPGGTVSVDVVAGAPATKLGGWQLLVSFDKTVVEPADPANPCPGAVSECVVLPGGAAVRVQGFSQSGLSGTVTLAEIPFIAVGAAGSSTAVSIQVVEFIDVADGSATNPAVTGGTITIQATPAPPTCYTLSTGVNPPGSGYVSADPASSGSCPYGQYGPGSSVQLTGVANGGWGFQNWSGDCSGAANPTAVTMTGDKSCTANFQAVTPPPTTPPPTTPPGGTPTPTPTRTPTPPPSRTPTPIPTVLEATATPRPNGDVDCDGDIDSVDALKILRHVAGMSVSQDEPCGDIGSTAALGGSAPEPLLAGVGLTGAAALAVGALAIGNRRRREDAEE